MLLFNYSNFGSRSFFLSIYSKMTVTLLFFLLLTAANSFAASISVTSPNGGETWSRGNTYTIRWTSSDVTENVQIQLDDNGSLSNIVSSTSNDGSYSWTIPSNGSIGSNYKIRVSSTTHWSTVYDYSNSTFTLDSGVAPGSITVTTPDGGESWSRGTTKTIRWSSTNVTENVQIQLDDNGSLSTIVSSTSNDGSYSWSIPLNGSIGSNFKIRVSSTTRWSTVYDYSDLTFTITSGTPPGSITVITPDGGESWSRGTTETISWSSSNVTEDVKIELDDNGSLSTIVSSTSNDGSYSWSIPENGAIGTNFKIRVSSTTQWATVYDYSNSTFSIDSGIPPGSIIVNTPNGGESWSRGTTETISWSSSNVTEDVKIELDDNGSLSTIVSSTSNDGSYSWSIPENGAIGTNFKIRVSSTTQWATVYDYSNSTFSIDSGIPPGSITVNTPNGGESWSRGTTETISWSSSNVTEDVKIELDDNGSLSTIVSSTSNDGSYSWSIPENGAIGTNFKIRVSSTTQWATVYDYSNSTFSIDSGIPPGSITVITPNGGESWQRGTSELIQWSSTDVNENVRIELLYNDQVESLIIDSTPNDGSYTWDIPVNGSIGSGFKIRVASTTIYSTVKDDSDATFSFNVINNDPELTNGYVDPTSGNTSTSFTYYVHYYDPDGDAPSSAQVEIQPDNIAWSMSLYSGTPSNGVYRTTDTINLDEGDGYTYSFFFDDGNDGEVSLGSLSGPTVIDNTAPQLSNGYVNPSEGNLSTNFTYYVHYYDPDGDAPFVSQVEIQPENVTYSMILDSGSPSDGLYRTEGEIYLTIDDNHTFSFYFEDTNGASVAFPIDEAFSGPIIQSILPVTQTFEFKDGVLYDLHAKPIGQQWNYPEKPTDILNFESLYLTYHGDTNAIPHDQALNSQLTAELALFITQSSSWTYSFRKFQKDDSIIYTAPYYRPLLMETAFMFHDLEDRQEYYKRYILEAIAMKDSPLDHAYVEMENENDGFIVQQLNRLDESLLGDALRTLKNAYGIGDTVWSGARDLGNFDKTDDGDLVIMLLQLEEDQPPGKDLLLLPVLRILKVFKERHQVLANSISAVQKYANIIGMVASTAYDAHVEAMAELLLRTYLNTSQDAQMRLEIFQEAYNHTIDNYEPNLDPGIENAIIELQDSINNELSIVEICLQNFFANISLVGAAEFILNLNDATQGGVKKIVGKVAVGAISSINKNAGKSFKNAYEGAAASQALTAASAIVNFLQLLDDRLDYLRDTSAILCLQEIIHQYGFEMDRYLSGGDKDYISADEYIKFDTAQDIELYLALKLCDRILQNYIPPGGIDLAKQGANLAVGIVKSPASAGLDAIGPAITVGNSIISYLNTVIFKDGIEEFRSERDSIRKEMQNRYLIKDSATESMSALYLAPSPPQLPIIDPPPASNMKIRPITSQVISPGEVLDIPIIIDGIEPGDTVEITYTGLVSGDGNTVHYTALESDIGSHAITISANSGSSGVDTLIFAVDVVGTASLEIINSDPSDFGTIPVNTNKTLTPFLVKNSGYGELLVNISIEEPFTLLSNTNILLESGESENVVVRFEPNNDNSFNKTITFTSNTGSESRQIYGQGEIAPLPDIKVFGSGNNVDIGSMTPTIENGTEFGSNYIGIWGATHTFIIENNGAGNLILTGSPTVQILGIHSNDFLVSSQPQGEISPSESLEVDIEFAPTESGYRSATVFIYSNDTKANPYVFAIGGSGVNSPVLPIINPIENEFTDANKPYSSPIPSLSQGTLPISWSLEAGPIGMIINSSNGIVSWDDPISTGSPYEITIRASNSEGFDEETWLLYVNSIALDGDPSDWDSIDQESMFTNYVDDEGDSLCGSDGDIKRIVTSVDDNFAYIMVETYGKPISVDAVLEIDFDFKAGQHIIGSPGIDLHTNITRDSFTAWDDNDMDGNDEVYPINGVEIAWGDVAEIRIPLAEIENTTYLYALDVNIWDDNYPVNDPPIGCDASHSLNSFGQGLSVDGFDKFAWAPHSSSLDIGGSQLTMESWVKLNGESENHWIISKQQIDGNRSYGFYINANERRVVPSIQADWFFEGSLGDKIIEYDTWYHVAIVYNGTNIKAYIDGELNGEIDLTGNLAHNTEILTIGGTYWNPTDTTNGSIDEVRIWNIALTQEEICTSMRKELVGDEPGLIGYWQFAAMVDFGVGDDGADDYADSSGNGNHADMYVGEAMPNIQSISPTRALPGDEITIVGQNFGATQGDDNVIFTDNLPSASITSWSDTEIVAVVPEGAVTGCVSVVTDSDTSNCVILIIDPLVSLDATQDATISQDNGSTNYGTPSTGAIGSYLGVGNDSMMFAPGGIGTTKALVQFDLSSLPQDVEIISAKLFLRRSIASNTGPTFTLNLRDVTSSWSENTVTWNNMTGIGGVVASVVDDAFMNPEIDITGKLIDWYQGTSANNGLLIEIANPVTGVYFAFGSREKTNFEPKLLVSYRLGDTDNDGLPDDIEHYYCTEYDDADTDNDGILDGNEDINHNGEVDPNETDPCDADTDNDGLQDGTEIGLTADDIVPDTDEGVFIPDEHPGSTTDPLNDDSDGDGLLDGEEDINHNGAVDDGETDPSVSNFVNGLIAHWMMDESSYDGTVDEVLDASGGGSHGTSYGGMTTVPLKSITAGNFDGVDDQIKIPSNNVIELGKRSFSISLWMKASQDQVWNRSHILEKDYSYQNSGLYRIVLLDGYLQFEVQGSATYTVVGETRVTDNTWHHIICVRDTVEKKIRLFVDGVEDAPALIETTIQDTSSGYPLAIGGPSLPSPSQGDIYMYKGLLDDVRIYNLVLDINEILDLAVIDSDEDGLVEAIERISCTDPNDADTDDDGILDGAEDANQNGVFDDDETNPCDADTDADGLQDGTEIGLTSADIGSDTDPGLFIPDDDPSSVTNPNNADSDGDLIPDGVEDINHNGQVDAWEPDPSQASSDVEPDLDDDGDVDGDDLAALASFFDPLTDQDKLATIAAMLGYTGFPVDADGDGVLDDGDFSGVVGDNPCTGGETLLCDDNCPNASNTDQSDTDNNGIGDVCDNTLGDCTNVNITGFWADPEWSNLQNAEDGDWNTAATVNSANKQLFVNHPYDGNGRRYWHVKYSSSGSQYTNFQCYDYDSEAWITIFYEPSGVSGKTVAHQIPGQCLQFAHDIQLRVHSASTAAYYEGEVLCEASTELMSENFNDEDFTGNPAWTVTNNDDSPGLIEVLDHELHIDRDVESGNGGLVGIQLPVDIDITSSTSISFDARAVFRNVTGGCGYSCTEYPVSVNLALEDAAGNPLNLRYAVNYAGAVQDVTDGNFKQVALDIPQDQWVRDITYTISDAWPEAVRLNQIWVYGNGWDYESYLDNILITE